MTGSTRPSVASVPTRRGPAEVAHRGAGATILALHGAMGGYDQGFILADALGIGARHVAVSRPGYLGTPLTSGASPEAQADLCADVLGALSIDRAVVAAVSGGGPCAIHFALRHPGRCRALILVSTCTGPVTTPVPLSFRLAAWLMRWPAVTDMMRRRAARDPDAPARRSIPDPVVRERTLADPAAGPLFRALLASTSDRAAARMPGTRNDIEVTRTRRYPLEEIRVPVLLVHGTDDDMVDASHARAGAAHIPGAELLLLEGGRHVALFTHLAEVRARVAAFLAARITDRP